MEKELPDVTYAYDLTKRMTASRTPARALASATTRRVTETNPFGTYTSAWNFAARRTPPTPDSFYVDQDYLVTGELAAIRENGATSGAGVLASYGYDDLGRRSSITRGDGSTTSYTYDNVSRLTQLAEDLSGTSYDQTLGFSYNPASQIVTNTRSNDTYAWTGHYNVNRGYTANGLNQYTASGSVTPTYDTKGNVTSAGSTTFTYSSENLLTGASGGITLAYDPGMRLYQTAGGTPGTTSFAYDGTDLIGEYNSSNALQRRYVHGPGTDEPVMWYEGSGTTDRRFLHTDERGSVVAIGSSSGTSVNTYDEYGIPRSSNTGRFQYTGQTWLPELGMYYYKARIYSPTLGRFLQADPMGYAPGMNRYAYVGADPLNQADPSGLCPEGSHSERPTGHFIPVCVLNTSSDRSSSSSTSSGNGGSSSAGAAGPYSGGPIGGSAACPNCIDASDPRSAASRAYWGGQYVGHVWVWDAIANSSQAFSLSFAIDYQLRNPEYGCLVRGDCSGQTYTPPAAPPPKPPTVLTCGVQAGICRYVPQTQYCAASRTRLSIFVPVGEAVALGSAVKGANQIAASLRFAVGVSVMQGLVAGKVIADYVDVGLYC